MYADDTTIYLEACPSLNMEQEINKEQENLKSLRSENHTPRFHLFNRSIRPYIL